MPYRNGLKSTSAHCYQHPVASAEATCDGCGQSICEICVLYVRTTVVCPACAGKVRRRQLLWRMLVAVGVLAGVVAVVLVLRALPTRFDYGVRTPDVVKARQRVEAERCDRPGTIAYEDELINAGDYRGALRDVKSFIKECGDWYRVHWVAYSAHDRLSEGDQAIAEATLLIAHDPNDADYRWWRGIIYEEQGRDAQAIEDYRAAIRNRPELTNIPFNLARVLERAGRPCEAKSAVEDFLRYHPADADETTLAQLARLTNVCGK